MPEGAIAPKLNTVLLLLVVSNLLVVHASLLSAPHWVIKT